MILQSLVRLAERQGKEAARQGQAVERGFDAKPVHWIIDIDNQGKVLGVAWTGQRPEGAKKDTFLSLSIPKRCGRTSGIAADLLVDKALYLFGIGDAGKKDRRQEAVDAFQAELARFKDVPEVAAQIAALRRIVEDLPAFCRKWFGSGETSPVSSVAGDVEVPKAWAAGHLFVFRIDGERFVTASPTLRARIASEAASAGAVDPDADGNDLCLVSGCWSAPKELIDAFSLPGPPGDGGPIKLISFNADAFCHLGRTGNENAPISVDAADQVFVALQHLCRPNGDNLKRLNAKTTVLFWSDAATGTTEIDELFGPCLDADPAAVRRIEMLYAAPQDGRPVPTTGSTPFHTLVVTREKGRVSVRSALLSTAEDVAKHILRWFADLDLGHVDGRPYRAIWALAKATVSTKAHDAEPVHDLIARLYLAAITGAPLPTEAMAAVLRRIRAHDKDADSPSRIALIKATLIRSYQKETPVSLDPAHPDPAYHLGRLFALLEQIQDKATGAAAGIAERYLGAAMGTPALVFPRLLKLHHHHLAKIGGGLAVHFGKQIDAVVARLPPKLPATQTLADQGSFMVGYHHQRAERFKPGSDASTSTPAKDQP